MEQNELQNSLDWLLKTPSGRQWEKIGTKKRAGVATPLFSLFSEKSLGIGELPDLCLLIDWCSQIGMSIIQLLPLNDVGYDFAPYDAQSTFALDPMFLSLQELSGINPAAFNTDLKQLKEAFPTGKSRIDYGIKQAKLQLLKTMFKSRGWEDCEPFQNFQSANRFWLKDYALFRVIKASYAEKSWQEWPDEIKFREAKALQDLAEVNREGLLFQEWLQWQIFEQFKRVKTYAEKMEILLLGDLPFLVSRDSADVWSRQDYFKLDLYSGAPPDMYFANGQSWGMPPYNWEAIAAKGYDYLIERLKYAENFYHLFRVDHFVGLFRIWTISCSQNDENSKTRGAFDPVDEGIWEEHGKRLLDVMLENTLMLPCAEDLGTVPDCSFKTIKEYGIPGMDVQRWTRDWDHTYAYKDPGAFRPNAIATLATHDSTSLHAWWEYEAGTIDELLFRNRCRESGFNVEELVTRFFNPALSGHGRLRWRREIESQEVLLSILGRPEEEVKDIIGWYRETYNETAYFWTWAGLPGQPHESFDPCLAEKTLAQVNRSASIFSIQLLQDWLSLDPGFPGRDAWEFRINFPGKISSKNWSLVMPFSLETLLQNPANQKIRAINARTGRIQPFR